MICKATNIQLDGIAKEIFKLCTIIFNAKASNKGGMMNDKIALFVDGGYLDKVLQDEFSYARIDYEKLSKWMSNGVEIFRTYYYSCLPYQSDPPTKEESERFSGKQKFHYSLNQLPRFVVREGKLELRGRNENGNPILVQKRVDILLGADLVLLSTKQRITHAGILTGDSDFLPAIEIAKNEGVLIHLFHSKQYFPHRDLWQIADNRTVINDSVIKGMLR